MIRKLKSIFSKEKKNEEVKIGFVNNENNKKIEISKQNIYEFFLKEGIDSTQRGTKICEYFGINTTLEYELSQTFFKEFTIGENKILVINPGHNIMSPAYHENIFVLTKEAKRDIKLNLILNL